MKYMSARSAAAYFKKQNPDTQMSENLIRNLMNNGFPCIESYSRKYIDVDTFEGDIREYSLLRSALAPQSTESKKDTPNGKIRPIKE